VLTAFCGGDALKVATSKVVDINDNDSTNLTENTLVDGNVYYIVGSIASSYSEDALDTTSTKYYLVPIESGKYVVLANSDTTLNDTIDSISTQTQSYLNGDIEDITTAMGVTGKLVSMDDELRELLYSWCDSTGYFNTSDQATIDTLVLPYVLYPQDWATIQRLAIVGLVCIVVGVVGGIVCIKKL
jgi:hypothetical protein